MPSAPSPRDRVLDAAARLFYEQGYSATGVNQLIREAGVAKASFYGYFSSKDDLALAYLQHKGRLWNDALDRAAAAHDDPSDRVLALFDFVRTFVADNGMRGCAFFNMAAEFPDAASAPRRHIARFKTDLRDRVQRLVADVIPDDGRVEQTAVSVFLLLEAAIAEAPAVDDLWPIDAARAAAASLLAG